MEKQEELQEKLPDEPVVSEVQVVEQKTVATQPEREIAYVVKDKSFPDLEVVKTANAWWSDPLKLNNLIQGFKSGLSVSETLAYAGITQNQWFYFTRIHPEFSAIKEICQQMVGIASKKNLTEKIAKGDIELSRWWTEHTDKRFGGKVDDDGEGKGNITNNILVSTDDEQVERLLAKILGGQPEDRPSEPREVHADEEGTPPALEEQGSDQS